KPRRTRRPAKTRRVTPARPTENTPGQPASRPTQPIQWETPGRSAMMGAMHPGAAKVQQALQAAGAKGDVQMLPNAVRTAAQAAESLGVYVGQMVASLCFETGGAPPRVRPTGANQVDTAKVAALSGVDAVHRATPEFVRTHTGQPIGGVAPVGHPAPVRTLVD